MGLHFEKRNILPEVDLLEELQGSLLRPLLMPEKIMNRFEHGVGMNIGKLLLPQGRTACLGTEVIIELLVDLKRIEEHSVAVVDDTLDLPFLFTL
jgi:hypothetical protein